MRLNESYLTRYKELKRQISELKDSQFSGSSNIVAYTTETANTWDIDWTVTQAGPMGAQAQVFVTFTADKMLGGFTAIENDIYVNNQRYINNEYPNPFIYMAFRMQDEPRAVDAAKQVIYSYVIQAGVGDNIKMKFRAVSVDIGSLGVQLNIQAGA